MSHFKITLAYDGTDYVGWQRQAAGVSLQGLLEDVLRTLDQRDVTVIGAGRTDAGVHALGQVASFSLARSMSAETLLRALNGNLPADVRVLGAVESAPTFHARFRALGKTYRYRIWHGDIASPFERRYAWHIGEALDVERMARAARLVEGRHDFAAFQGAGSATTSTEREVFSSIVHAGLKPCATTETAGLKACATAEHELITYEIAGDGFLRHMVRSIVGTLVEIGRGRRPAEWMSTVLESRERGRAGPTAPPEGLFLVAVRYDDALAAQP